MKSLSINKNASALVLSWRKWILKSFSSSLEPKTIFPAAIYGGYTPEYS